jgi:transposase
VVVGLEDSKKTWRVCVRSGRMVVHETSMPAEYEALRNYFRNKFPECRIRVMYEAGFRGFNLYDNLVADGWECVVTPPHTVTEEKCNKQKNDTYDCRRLAKNNENGDYRTCHVPDKQLREDRQVSRLCGQVQKDITRVSNRIRREIEYHGLERQFPMGPWSSGTYRQARETVKGLAISEELRFTFEMHFRELEILRSMKLKALRRLRQIGDSQRYKRTVELLESAPGIGRLTATRLALEWGDLQRFKTKEGFASFLGLIPSDYSSGEADHKGHITKQGNRQVRAWLIESTWIAIRKDPVLLEKYRAVLSHSGSGKKAIVATARKFAMRLRAVVLRGEPYEIGLIECEHGVKSGETESCDKVEQKVAA